MKWKNISEVIDFINMNSFVFMTKEDISEVKEALLLYKNEAPAEACCLLYAIEYDEATRNNKSLDLTYCKEAAELGNPNAQCDLGIHYLYGESIEQNTFEAINWLEKSAYSGYFEACKLLIRLFKTGTKVKKSPVRAAYWAAKLENSSYCETFSLLPFAKEMATPEPKLERKPIKPPFAFETFDKIFKTVEQERVIEAHKNESFIINAGPGTGKTYTLIRKIENLVSKQGVDATEIVVLSFTNAVVKEVKSRLSDFANEGNGDRSLRNVDVKTFHSFAYWLLKQANENIESLEGWEKVNLDLNKLTYDDCMSLGAKLITKMPDVVAGWQYFVVDEIQDINHGKAQFVLSILNACVKNNIPFCFLGDSCQAIYDYLDEKNSSEVRITSEEFYKKLFELANNDTKMCSFAVNHRSVSKIQMESAPIRKLILSEEATYYPAAISDYRKQLECIDFEKIKEFLVSNNDKKICIMERSNLNTRFISSQMIKAGMDHICLLSLQKGSYPQWIGQLFGGYSEEFLTKENLKSIIANACFSNVFLEKCWNSIQKELKIPSEIVPFLNIISVLLTHNLDEIYNENNLKQNIFVSNIHRTKGLEYDYVLIDENFLLSRHKDSEEMKVLYVAITRAKKETFCLKNTNSMNYLKSLSWSNRHYKKEKIKNKNFRIKYVEILSGEEISDVGPECFVMPNMIETQKIINSLKANETIELVFDPKSELYAINAKGARIGWMNKSFSKGVYYTNNGDYPPKFNDIYIDGVFTYIGSIKSNKSGYERKLQEYNNSYSKYRIWNYITFSGLAHAVYQ